ncbi:sigma-70 family RNA polymerase sigma factor [Capnocytophaga sputigena]|uniref:sigma-70 family RNA polymerase sigma factor n=1 Tax=Capnocytophaga sputigena TaxID=1019 RepID=UPI000BB1C7B9|nr:sigma-70 family RNA polymerase sigma factor [Capnocytophaga sputigena]ATA70565.1 RNA polymerase subunit sigma [Capnocytophaga sputigena]
MRSSTEEVAQWVDAYSEHLLNCANYLVSDGVEAEDLVQEVFLTALSSYDSFQNKSNPLTWLKAILNHKIADYYKKKYKTPLINFDYFFDEDGSWKKNQEIDEWEDESSHSLENLLDNPEFNKILRNALNKLPTKWGLLMKMCYLEGKKSSEICQVMNITPTNYWKILQRSRMQLREYLEINWFNK